MFVEQRLLVVKPRRINSGLLIWFCFAYQELKLLEVIFEYNLCLKQCNTCYLEV